MQPASVDLMIYKGATFSKQFQWQTGSTPTPVDLTGCTARMQVRKTVQDTAVLDTLTTENGKLVINDALLGKFKINLTAAQTGAYTFINAAYDLEIVYYGGEPVYRVLSGCFSVDPEVTR